MGIRSYKPTSPARRYYSVSDFKEVTRDTPERALTEHQTSTGGRNNHGRITSRFRGGGHKQRYRLIDWKRDKIGIPAQVAAKVERSFFACRNHGMIFSRSSIALSMAALDSSSLPSSKDR